MRKKTYIKFLSPKPSMEGIWVLGKKLKHGNRVWIYNTNGRRSPLILSKRLWTECKGIIIDTGKEKVND